MMSPVGFWYAEFNIFGTEPYEHCRIGGKWKLFVDCCNLYEEMRMRFGAPVGGKNTALYVKVVAN